MMLQKQKNDTDALVHVDMLVVDLRQGAIAPAKVFPRWLMAEFARQSSSDENVEAIFSAICQPIVLFEYIEQD